MASIKKVGDNAWQVRVFLGRKNGKTLRHTKVVHGTKRTAEEYARKKESARDLGKLDVEIEQITLSKWMARWLESRKGSLRERTIEWYTYLIDEHINKSKLADKYLDRIKPLDVQDFYDAVAEKYSPNTCRHVHTALSAALERAAYLEYIPKNPTKYATRPRLKRRDFKVFNIEESQRFLKAAEADRYHVLFVIAVTLGLRPEEYQALQWKDFDAKKRTLKIERTYYESKEPPYGWKFAPVKTDKSARTLKLSQTQSELLENQRTRVGEMKKEGFIDYDLIFPSEAGTPMRLVNLRERHFNEILKRAGMPTDYRMYSMRHTCATVLLAAKEDIKVVSEILGHKSVSFTMDTYQHVLDSQRDSASERIENIFFAAPKQKQVAHEVAQVAEPEQRSRTA